MDGVAANLLKKLRQLAPHKVRVFDGDEVREVAVPTRRKRWTQVIETIEARRWEKCELVDKAGSVLGYVHNVDADILVEDDGSISDPSSGRWGLELMLRAQKEALSWRSKEHADLLAGMRDLLEVNTRATHELIEIFRVQRDVSADIAAMRAAAESGGDLDQIVKLIEASPQLLQGLGPLLGALLRKAPKAKLPPPPNGVPK